MLLPRGAGDVRGVRAQTAAPSSQGSTYPHQALPTTEDTRAANAQCSRTAVDDHAFLFPSDPVISGCDLIGSSPSSSLPFPTCNDLTHRGPVHPKRGNLCASAGAAPILRVPRR